MAILQQKINFFQGRFYILSAFSIEKIQEKLAFRLQFAVHRLVLDHKTAAGGGGSAELAAAGRREERALVLRPAVRARAKTITDVAVAQRGRGLALARRRRRAHRRRGHDSAAADAEWVAPDRVVDAAAAAVAQLRDLLLDRHHGQQKCGAFIWRERAVHPRAVLHGRCGAGAAVPVRRKHRHRGLWEPRGRCRGEK